MKFSILRAFFFLSVVIQRFSTFGIEEENLNNYYKKYKVQEKFIFWPWWASTYWLLNGISPRMSAGEHPHTWRTLDRHGGDMGTRRTQGDWSIGERGPENKANIKHAKTNYKFNQLWHSNNSEWVDLGGQFSLAQSHAVSPRLSFYIYFDALHPSNLAKLVNFILFYFYSELPRVREGTTKGIYLFVLIIFCLMTSSVYRDEWLLVPG